MKGTPQATPDLGLCMRAVGSVLSGSGGRGLLRVVVSCGCVRLIIHLKGVGLSAQPRDLDQKSITKRFEKIWVFFDKKKGEKKTAVPE